MKMYLRLLLTVAFIVAVAAAGVAGSPPQKGSAADPAPATYVITNDDASALLGQNSISFFQAGGTPSAPSLTYQTTLFIGGTGIGGGFFGTSRLNSLPDSGAQCLYVSDAGSGAVVAVNLQTQQAAGTFFGSENDAGTTNGIGLGLNANYLYASFTDSNTIGTFTILPGCQLSFVNDVSVGGLNGGTIYAMALSGNILVVSYADGSIESFNIGAGTPVPNGDAQNSTGYVIDYNNLPDGIDISQNGHYAIFGDAAVSPVVEVSDISSGKLKPTTVYRLGAGPTAVAPNAVVSGVNSSNVRLSPDESLLFISNNQSGTVTAGFFNPATGSISPGCTSATLSGFYSPWAYVASMVTENTSGNGGVLYVAEFGVPSSIGILTITSTGGTCRLAESINSPAVDPITSGGVLSIWAYPPRPF